VGDIVETAAREWISTHLRFVDPRQHIVCQNEIHPGSPELTDIFLRRRMTANDTSAAVGFAPLSETETLVLLAEEYLNSAPVKQRFPAVGEDVKVMGVRRDRRLSLTVAIAFVDRFVRDPRAYDETKRAVQEDLRSFLRRQLRTLDDVSVRINLLDDPERGESGMYLTVLGTSAEGADGGEVGRGNRVNGLISLNRPMSLEAAAGKNPVSHVGKIYNLLSHHLAGRICSAVSAIEETTVWMCSQIGGPLEEPWAVDVAVSLAPGTALGDVSGPVREIVSRELGSVSEFVERVCRGEFRVC
jgi:S-adenosylmethionine synthetase